MKEQKPISRRTNIVVQESGDETLVYDLKKNKALCLNETSAFVWKMCNGETSISEIAEGLTRRLRNPVSDEYVLIAVDQFKKENLLENADEIDIDFGGMSRRTVIRKLGLASMIALPIISSIVAPTAANAQSCGSNPPGTTFSGGVIADCADCQTTCAAQGPAQCASCRADEDFCNSPQSPCQCICKP